MRDMGKQIETQGWAHIVALPDSPIPGRLEILGLRRALIAAKQFIRRTKKPYPQHIIVGAPDTRTMDSILKWFNAGVLSIHVKGIFGSYLAANGTCGGVEVFYAFGRASGGPVWAM